MGAPKPADELGFLSVDEVMSLDKLLADARYEARKDERAGRTEWARDRLVMIADVQGVVDRHRSFVREALGEVDPSARW